VLRQGWSIREVFHPQFLVRRDLDGTLRGIVPAREADRDPTVMPESWMHLEILPPPRPDGRDPPVSNLEQGRPEHGWWKDYKSKLPATLNAAGFTCVGPAKPQDYGLEDTTMWDGYHSSDVLMARNIYDPAMKTAPNSTIRRCISPRLAELATFSGHPLSLDYNRYKP